MPRPSFSRVGPALLLFMLASLVLVLVLRPTPTAESPASATTSAAAPPASPPTEAESTPASLSAPDSLRQATSSRPAPLRRSETSTANHRIAPLDQLRVEFASHPELSGIYRVDRSGYISLPLIGRLSVQRLRIQEALERIREAMRARRLSRNPQVTLSMQAYAPREVFVFGEVVEPGRFPIPPGETWTVRDAIVAAGGFIPSANTGRITVTRRQSDGSTTKVPFDPDDLLDDPKDPLLLQPNDIVYVPMSLL